MQRLYQAKSESFVGFPHSNDTFRPARRTKSTHTPVYGAVPLGEISRAERRITDSGPPGSDP
jgi:hypothetical protein